MANKNLVLRLLITAKDEASGVLSSMQAKAAAVAAAIVGYFSVDFLAGSVRRAGDFEAAMSRVKAATGAAGAEFEALKKAAEDAGANTRFTSVEAAQGLENLAKAGLSATQAITALPAVLQLAEAGDVSLAESATYVTRTVSGMGVAIEDAGRIADVLAKGANASNTSVKGLAEALSYAGPTARSLGLSLEQTVGYIGKFADAGIDASRAGTALNAILAQFQDPASKFRAELTAAGITTGNFDAALRALVVSGAKGEKAILAVGTEAGPALRGLINQGLGALDDLTGKLKNAAGSAKETSDVMGANLNGALSGLSSAWDALRIKLGEPALEVVTTAVKDLTAGLQAAVSNGTVTAFGEAIRSAFASGAEWARKFAGEIDPAALAAKLQSGATQVGQWFDKISESARNAGDVVRTAYGVMSAGTGAVLGSIYKIAEVFSAITFAVVRDAAAIAEGLSKISFGSVSAGFKAAAAELRVQAGAAAAVAQEFGRSASKAFDDVVSGAELAQRGWAGLTAPAKQAAAAVQDVAAAARVTADDLDKAGEGATVAARKITALGQAGSAAAGGIKASGDAATAAGQQQRTAADQAAESVKALRAEYDALVAGGDAQGAVRKLQEINAALQSTKATAKDAADALTAAYQAMGLKSQADLKAKADEFKRHYEAIKADGTATADIISKAFQTYAEKAVEANGGVVSAALKTEAAMRGLTIQADGASVSVHKIGEAGKAAGAGVASGMSVASSSIAKMRSEAEKLVDELDNVKRSGATQTSSSMGTKATYDDLRKNGITPAQMQSMGYSAREIEDYIVGNDKAAPGIVNRQVTTSSINSYSVGVQNGLNDAEAKKFADLYGYYIEKANAEAASQAGGTMGLGFGADQYWGLQKKALTDALAEAKRQVSDEARAAAGKPATQEGIWGEPNRTVTVNINLGGRQTTVTMHNQQSANDLLRVLEEAGLASR